MSGTLVLVKIHQLNYSELFVLILDMKLVTRFPKSIFWC